MIWLFAFFLISGFCSLVYEVVWLRLAMAQFGVNTALVSMVLSVFMAGLALGSWGAGRIARRVATARAPKIPSPALSLRLYACAELAIGLAGLAVPPALRLGHRLLALGAGGAAWASSAYYLASGAWIALVLMPPCACMGATLPLAMAAIGAADPSRSRRSFSYLYLANVLGASCGTLGSALVLIELLGFTATSLLAAALNGILALAAFGLAFAWRPAVPTTGMAAAAPPGPASDPRLRAILWFLVLTGLSSMGMEVIWIRQFTPSLGPLVYTFATILASYLLATCLGAAVYRRSSRRPGAPRGVRRLALLCAALGLLGLVPLLGADPRLVLPLVISAQIARVVLSVAPFCALLGFTTPLLVDRFSSGDPRRAGTAYAANVLGCIAGPLLAGFVLLPAMEERWALFALAAPFLLIGLLLSFRELRPALATAAAATAALILVVETRGFASAFPWTMVRRDSTATVVAAGAGMGKRLLVNGVGITSLTPITKMMAHLPLALLGRPPRNCLVICLGMGTTFRSALAWGIPVTVVELVPSVPSVFEYFHPDAPERLRSPLARVVIDDGRRFLERSPEIYDVITVDPPPPMEAAGSSLLYSREFYELAKRRLGPDGILQQWMPGGEPAIQAAVAGAIGAAFPEVCVYRSIEGWGYHLLASRRAIPRVNGNTLAARLPDAAVRDLLEWGPLPTAALQLGSLLEKETLLENLIAAAPGTPPIEDDRPVNEYFLVRRLAPRLSDRGSWF